MKLPSFFGLEIIIEVKREKFCLIVVIFSLPAPGNTYLTFMQPEFHFSKKGHLPIFYTNITFVWFRIWQNPCMVYLGGKTMGAADCKLSDRKPPPWKRRGFCETKNRFYPAYGAAVVVFDDGRRLPGAGTGRGAGTTGCGPGRHARTGGPR